jgi:lysophospholipase L1-like esterase
MRRLLLTCTLLAYLAQPSWADRYIAFGDSITEGYGDDPTRTELGYPPRLQALLRQGVDPEAVVENFGVSGESTPQGLARLESVLSRGGDHFIVMEGTNDITFEISPETTRFNISEMGRRAGARGFDVVHGTLIPRTPAARRDSDNRITAAISQQIRDLAGSANRGLADPFEVFSVIPRIFLDEYLADPTDTVGHPNAKGYDRLAALFHDVYAGVDKVPPVVGVNTPADGAFQVPRNSEIFMDLWDFGTGLDLDSIQLLVDERAVPATVRGGPRVAEVSWQPSPPLSGAVRVSITARDRANPPNQVTNRLVSIFLIQGSRYLEGDIDEDGRVDGSDLVRMGLAFGARVGETRYLATADPNGDGLIDGNDLARLASNFGKTGP